MTIMVCQEVDDMLNNAADCIATSRAVLDRKPGQHETAKAILTVGGAVVEAIHGLIYTLYDDKRRG